MGRPPSSSNNNNISGSGTRCRFSTEEVAEMENLLVLNNGLTPSRSVQESLAEKFSKDRSRSVRPRQIWSWFQNRRYKLAKQEKADGPSSSGRSLVTCTAEQLLAQRANGLQFETISSKDGAWYDIRSFLGHRVSEAGTPTVYVRYAGLGGDEDEWVELKSIRRRSLPCEGFECLAVYPGDSVLCFQEGDDHALYYDARVIDVHRKKHDARGCRCRFWIRYDHDQFEEVVTLRKVCRRPETDYRLKMHEALLKEKSRAQQENNDNNNSNNNINSSSNNNNSNTASFSRRRKRIREEAPDSGNTSTSAGTTSGGNGLSIDLNLTPPAEPSCFADIDSNFSRQETFLLPEPSGIEAV